MLPALRKLRYAIADIADFPVPHLDPKPPAPPLSAHARCAAKIIAKLRHVLEGVKLEYNKSAAWALEVKTVIVGAEESAENRSMWMLSMKFRAEVWATELEEQSARSASVRIPLQQRPLWWIFQDAHRRVRRFSGDGEGFGQRNGEADDLGDCAISILRLSWNQGSTHVCSIVDASPAFDLVTVCRCCPRGRGGGAGRRSRGRGSQGRGRGRPARNRSRGKGDGGDYLGVGHPGSSDDEALESEASKVLAELLSSMGADNDVADDVNDAQLEGEIDESVEAAFDRRDARQAFSLMSSLQWLPDEAALSEEVALTDEEGDALTADVETSVDNVLNHGHAAAIGQPTPIAQSSSGPRVSCMDEVALGSALAEDMPAMPASSSSSSPPTAQRPPSANRIQSFLRWWAECLLCLTESLEFAHRTEAPRDKSISLVWLATETLDRSSSASMRWIHWDSIAEWRGRALRLDPQRRIIYAHPVESRSYQLAASSGTMCVIIADTGVRMIRAKGDDRPCMPAAALRVLEFHESLLYNFDIVGSNALGRALSLAPSALRDPCRLCRQRQAPKRSASETAEASASEHARKVCPLCTMTYHMCCAVRLIDFLQERQGRLGDIDEAGIMEAALASAACAPDRVSKALEVHNQHIIGGIVDDARSDACPLCSVFLPNMSAA